MTACPECGAHVDDGLRCCPECGNGLAAVHRHDGAPPRSPRDLRPLVVAGGEAPQEPAAAPAGARTVITAGGDVVQQGQPATTPGGTSIITAGGNVVQHGPPSPAPGSKSIVTAGNDVIQAGGDVYKADGDLVMNVTVVEGGDHDQFVGEYRHRFRELLEGLRRAKRPWLKPGERQQLDDLAQRLKLRDWEQRDAERDVQDKVQFFLGARPSELWHVAAGSQYLAKQKERHDAVESLADYLDTHAPGGLRVWRKGLPDWVSLETQTDLLAEVHERRKVRYGELLHDAARHNRLDASRPLLEQAAQGISTADQHALWRAVEMRCGRKLAFRGAAAPPPPPPPRADQTPLKGKFEAVKDFAIGIEVSGRTLYLSNTRPHLQEGSARIDGLQLDDTGRFSFALSKPSGDFFRIVGMQGRVLKDKLVIDAILGTGLRPEDRVFEREFKRLV